MGKCNEPCTGVMKGTHLSNVSGAQFTLEGKFLPGRTEQAP